MKRKIRISRKLIFTLLIAGLLCTLNASNYDKVIRFEKSSIHNTSKDSTASYLEDFESGLSNWETVDATDPGSFWQTSSFEAYGDSGKSWRMGDPYIYPNGGYLDEWYQVLDTPVIELPTNGNLTLTFYQKRSIEEIGGTEDFDGWDGLNIRIRNADQDYSEAEILTNCDPAYNSSSMYSFGFQHNEDPDGVPGIPGWGGSIDWVFTSINIPQNYAGENVIISFAFASDPNTSTETNPEFTGIFIDEINVADIFSNNGNNEIDFTSYTNTVIGEDLWHTYNDPSAPSPSHALGCFDSETNTYNANMQNYLISDNIAVPFSGYTYFDMFINSEFDDAYFPDCDYFSIEVRYLTSGTWSNWNSISNPLGDPNGENVVFTGSTDQWSLFSQGWSGYNDLSQLAGYTIQLKIGFHSNDQNNDYLGLRIDDLQLLTIEYPGPSPIDLTSLLLNNFMVKLNWAVDTYHHVVGYNIYHSINNINYDFIEFVSDTTYIHPSPQYDQTNYYRVSVVYDEGESTLSNSTETFVPSNTSTLLSYDDGTCDSIYSVDNFVSIANRFEINDPNQYLTHGKAYIGELNSGALVLKVWEGQIYPENLLTTKTFLNSELDFGWNILALQEAIPITQNYDLFIGFQNFNYSPKIGLDESSFGYSYKNLDEWTTIGQGNLMIQAILDTGFTEINEQQIPDSKYDLTNYPNPFNLSAVERNPSTTISFNLQNPETIALKIYNLKGQLVYNVVEKHLTSGEKTYVWNGIDKKNKKVSSGVYIYKLETKESTVINKMLLLK